MGNPLTLLEPLVESGWVLLPDFLDASQVEALRQLAQRHREQGDFYPAGIGANRERTRNPTIRGDQICWLEPEPADEANVPVAYAEFCRFLAALRRQLNRSLYLGLGETEVHLALYPPGGRYQKHIDNFRGRSARIITFILYLNADWQSKQGGQLRLYTNDDNEHECSELCYTDISPQGGTLLVFLSERFYHEVLPASRERLSLTGWLRRRELLSH